MRHISKKMFWGISLAGAVLAVGAILFSLWRNPARAGTAEGALQEPNTQDQSVVTVRTIHPKCDPSFALSVKAPAQVVPYEAADLEAQVAGQVEFIRKAEGALVKAGEILVKIAV